MDDARVTVRNAVRQDYQFIWVVTPKMVWELMSAERRAGVDEENSAELVRRHVDALLPTEGTSVFVAVDQRGKHIGVLLMGERRHLFTGSYEGFVYYVYVDPQYRLKGVGRRLLAEAERTSRERQYEFLNLEVMATNNAMQALMASCGYSEEYVGFTKSLRPWADSLGAG